MATGSAGAVLAGGDSVSPDGHRGQGDKQRDVERMGMGPSADLDVRCDTPRARRPVGIGFDFTGKIQEGRVGTAQMIAVNY